MKKYRFRRWLRNWISNFDADESVRLTKASAVQANKSIGDHRDSMDFHICRATGGYIVEFNTYDRKRDENNRNLHIITDEQDLGDSIAKIVTIEMLRN
jgi:hypothetical protein